MDHRNGFIFLIIAISVISRRMNSQKLTFDKAASSYAYNDDCLKFNQFKCVNNGMCIELNQVCNGVFDCGDGSDELHCDSKISLSTILNPLKRLFDVIALFNNMIFQFKNVIKQFIVMFQLIT